MNQRTLMAGSAVVGLLAVSGAWWSFSGQDIPLAMPTSSVKTATIRSTVTSAEPSPEPDSPKDDLDLHLNWASARPDAVALVRPAPLWSTADLGDMLPDTVGTWITAFDERCRHTDAVAVPSDTLTDLSKLLDQRSPAADLDKVLRLTDTLTLWTGEDLLRQASVGRVGLAAVKHGLAESPTDDSRAVAIDALSALPEGVWWRSNDQKALEELFSLRLQWSDPSAEAYQWARIGLSEINYMQGGLVDAFAMNEMLLGDNKLTRLQRMEVQYNQGIILFAQDKMKEAIECLRSASADGQFHHARDAAAYQIYARIRLGDLQAAQAQFLAYKRDWTPSEKEIDFLAEAFAERQWQVAYGRSPRR